MKSGRYRHYKGNEYIVIGVARHSETDEELVVYRQDYGEQGLWVRPKKMFLETVEVDGEPVPRFEFVAGNDDANEIGVTVRLRNIERNDLPTLFEFQPDPEANRLAATYPRSKKSFDAHWAKVLEDPSIIAKAITVDDVLAGSISCFKSDGLDLAGYWIGKEFWGQGVTTRALQLFLVQVPIRPLHARVSVTNRPSLRVLQKCGFRITGYRQSPADDRYLECEEAILELAYATMKKADPMVRIRPATSDDARAIAHVQVQTWRSAYRGILADDFLDAMSEDDRTVRWSEILQRPKHAMFVAEVEDQGIVGFANGGPEREGREDYRGELCGLYVLPDWHGQGVGKRLVATFARWLIDSDFDTMMVWVLADNPFRRFYKRLGGKLIGKNEIQIGQQTLGEVAFGWDDVAVLTADDVA